jgi:hypothetical protein
MRRMFEMFDPEGTGEVELKEFIVGLSSYTSEFSCVLSRDSDRGFCVLSNHRCRTLLSFSNAATNRIVVFNAICIGAFVFRKDSQVDWTYKFACVSNHDW